MQAEVEVVVRHHHVAVLLRELGERLLELRVALAGRRAHLAALLALEVAHGREGRQILEIEPFDEPGAVTTLRAHHHERLVGGHPEEPGGEAGVAAEAPEAAHHLQKGGLEEVTTVLIGDRVAEQLALDVRAEARHQGVEGGGIAVESAGQQITIQFECHGPGPFPERLPGAFARVGPLRGACRRVMKGKSREIAGSCSLTRRSTCLETDRVELTPTGGPTCSMPGPEPVAPEAESK